MKIYVFARLFTPPLFLVFALAGCSASKPNEETPSSSRDHTLSGAAKYLEPGGFNPDGYFIVNKALTIEGRKLSSLELSTVQVDSTGKLSDERPALLQPPVGFLTVSEPNSVNNSMYPCSVAVIVPDSLSVRCVAPPVGEVTINGHFLDNGDYSDKFAETSTILLVARVVVSKGGKITHDALHRFTYYTGD